MDTIFEDEVNYHPERKDTMKIKNFEKQIDNVSDINSRVDKFAIIKDINEKKDHERENVKKPFEVLDEIYERENKKMTN